MTIKEIAKLCGVSEGTVDRAINNRPGIKEETRQRVIEVAKLLNYKPNRIAQSLATGRTMTIGIICFDLYNNFFTSLIDIIEANAKSKGYFVNLILTHRDMKKEMEGIQYLVERNVDGIIIFPVGRGERYVDYLKSTKKPIVTIYNKISDEFSHIGVDDRKAMSDAVKFIKAKGYERIYFITPAISNQERNGSNVYTLKRRLKGYIDGLQAYGVNHDPLVVEGKDFDKEFKNLDLKQKTAMLCICDTYALETMKYFRDRNFSVPGDIGIMGYDNIDVLKYIKPQLSTIEYHVEKMGNLVFDTLFDTINGKQAQPELLLDYNIIHGETI
jgi:LacI family transcriptional regulator